MIETEEGKAMHSLAVALAALVTLAHAGLSLAQHDHHGSTSSAKATAEMAQGEVREVNAAAKTVKLKHGPIASVDMPSMTMSFPVADAKLIDGLQPGDKVRFSAQKRGDTIVVTRIEKLK
jgi:Cu/Ag efflux protein CusF